MEAERQPKSITSSVPNGSTGPRRPDSLRATRSARSMVMLGKELIESDRPTEAFGAFVAAIQAVPPRSWTMPLTGLFRSALWELTTLLLDGSVDDEVRLQTNQELRGFLLMLLRRTDRRDERVLCLSGLAKVELSGTPSERCLGAVAELRAEVGRRRGQSDYDDELVDAVALLASAVVRKTSGHHVPEASEARRRLLAPRLWTGSPWRRLLVRSLITHAVLAMETGHHSALNSSSEAVGHANHLRGGFRAVLMAEALDVRSRVLGDLGRHTEAAMAEVQAISLRAAEACSLRVT